MAELDGIEAPPGFANHQWLRFKSNMKTEKAKVVSKFSFFNIFFTKFYLYFFIVYL